jgi:hypothetical protein
LVEEILLLFIGGAARTGKGILVRRLLLERHMSFLSLDVLKMGLTRGVPEFEINPDEGVVVIAERLWSLVREMSLNLMSEGVDYVLEGELLPKHVAALQQEYPTQVRACFLGYCTITPEQKLRAIRSHAGFPNDWSSEYSDMALLQVLEQMIDFSQYLLQECQKYNLPYFDTSSQFLETLDRVFAFVCALQEASQ